MSKACTLILAALLLAGPALPAVAGPATLRTVSQTALTASDLMVQYGLDQVLPVFGESLAASPRMQGIPDRRFLEAWEGAAGEVFDGAALNARLAAELDRALTPAEMGNLGMFLLTPFGQRVIGLEMAIQQASPDQQMAVLAEGRRVLAELSPLRRAALHELIVLTSADQMIGMVAESIRGMALGMHLAGARGDIDVPWEDIDAAVSAELDGMREELAESTRGVLAFTYDSLSDAEFEDYLDFLRRPVTQKFYTVTTRAIGAIVHDAMFELGEAVAARLSRTMT